MGTDAVIFAEKAKRYFYFDRLRNFTNAHWECDDDTPEIQRYRDILRRCVRGMTFGPMALGVSAPDVLFVVTENSAFWAKEGSDDAHRVQWNEGIAQFARAFPDDNFFVVDDTGNDEYYWPDVRDKLGAIEWKPKSPPAPPSPYTACLCVQRDGKWWCPNHQGPPVWTLDRYPPYCADCYYKIQKQQLKDQKTDQK